MSRLELKVFDVEELDTHGGSLRVFMTHANTVKWKVSAQVQNIIDQEMEAGMSRTTTYEAFHEEIIKAKRDLLRLLIDLKNNDKHIVGYGAPAKGNTLLNYCGIGTDFIDYVVDRSPHKQGRWLPGSRIQIFPPGKICETKPDYVLVLPWNLKNEIISQLEMIRDWGGKFIIPIPQPEIVP